MRVINGQATSFSINAGNSRKGRTFHYRLLKADMTPLTAFTATGVSEALQNDDATATGSYGVTITITDVLTRFIQWRDTTDERCWISEITVVDDYISSVETIRKIETKRWKIVGNQMIFYDDDNSTPILTVDLKDSNGNATESNPKERMPTT